MFAETPGGCSQALLPEYDRGNPARSPHLSKLGLLDWIRVNLRKRLSRKGLIMRDGEARKR